MPLNTSQRQILRQLVDIAVDEIIDQNTIVWLKRCIEPCKISREDCFTLFEKEYLDSISECSKVGHEIRHAWRTVARSIIGRSEELPRDAMQLLEQHANYNPYNLADLKQLEVNLISQNIPTNKATFLLRLRELFLEMTPMDDYQYGRLYISFHYRLGVGPLRGAGPIPLLGEIQEDIEEMVEKRIELFEEELEKLEKIQQEARIQLDKQQQELDKLQTKARRLAKDKKKIVVQLQQKEEQMNTELQKKEAQLVEEQQRTQAQLMFKEKQILEEQQQWKIALQEKEEQLENTKNRSAQREAQLQKEREQVKRLEAELQNQKNNVQDYQQAVALQEQELEEALIAKIVENEKTTQESEKTLELMNQQLKEERKKNEKLMFFVEERLQKKYIKPTNNPSINKEYEKLLLSGRAQEKLKNYDDAFENYRTAKEQGCLEAYTKLARLIMSGKVDCKDKNEAKKLLEAAANQSDVKAQFNLAMMYEYGDGICQDLEKALYWYELATAQGDTEAEKRVPNVNKKIQERERLKTTVFKPH